MTNWTLQEGSTQLKLLRCTHHSQVPTLTFTFSRPYVRLVLKLIDKPIEADLL